MCRKKKKWQKTFLVKFALPYPALMSSDAKEHIRDKLRCRPNDAVASAQPHASAAIFP